MAKERSPERAAAVLDRASRMRAFRAGLLDRRLFDKQMRTPGRVKASSLGNLNTLPLDALISKGVQTVKLRDVKSDQPTVSLKAVKAKLGAAAPSSPREMPLVLRMPNGQMRVIDGNHRLTAARALGRDAAQVRVVELKGAAQPLAPKVLVRTKGGRAMQRERFRAGSLDRLTSAVLTKAKSMSGAGGGGRSG